MMRIIGIDPGTPSWDMAFRLQWQPLQGYYGSGARTEIWECRCLRQLSCSDRLTEIIQEYKPDEASIEELFF